MPLGFTRLNERTQRPNAHINFIRTLPGSTSATAEGILNRVAAICYPLMKQNTILVQALEEFPYNNEFVGRNFNAGEVIQLVLRNRRGEWLPERWVMMVMVHELAHCKQMNHSRAFWKVRDGLAVELRALWAKGYTGEGLWGRGRDLDRGAYVEGSTELGDVPEQLCGGTYSRRRRKRKRGAKGKQELTYQEQKERRIRKKFGAGGQALGADDEEKVKLEGGGTAKKGKPRVAGSARGRELRAAAALARFEPVKKEDEIVIKKEDTGSESETDDEYGDAGIDDAAIDVDGKKMFDDEGRALIKICEDEDSKDENARRELDELHDIDLGRQYEIRRKKTATPPEDQSPKEASLPKQAKNKSAITRGATQSKPLSRAGKVSAPLVQASLPALTTPAKASSGTCPVCSLDNEKGAIACIACSHVLQPHLMESTWSCLSEGCRDIGYVNSGDVGVCGICGTRKA